MRFISEFEELHHDFIHRNVADIKVDAERDLGHFLAQRFGWNTPHPCHHTLEIEAFPADKWVEFKNKLFNHIVFNNGEDKPVDEIKILKWIKELESYGNKETAKP